MGLIPPSQPKYIEFDKKVSKKWKASVVKSIEEKKNILLIFQLDGTRII